MEGMPSLCQCLPYVSKWGEVHVEIDPPEGSTNNKATLSWWLVLGFLFPHNVALNSVGMKESSSSGWNE